MSLHPVSPAPKKVPPGSLHTADEREKGGRWRHGNMQGREEGKEERKKGRKTKEEGREEGTNFLIRTPQGLTTNHLIHLVLNLFIHHMRGITFTALTLWAEG